MKRDRKFLLYFFTSLTTFLLLMTLHSYQTFQNFINYENSNFKKKQIELKVLTDGLSKVSHSIFDNLINTEKVIEIFQYAHKTEGVEQNRLRDRLYKLLEKQYSSFTQYGIQQLHFHLPNNDSFLRFHKPQKYGDNLTNIRESVKFVNKEKKSIVGFEEGKIFNGYRYVYPMFDKHKQHIGSVEVSASLLSFKKTIESTKGLHIDYILKKDVVEKKLFKDQFKNYKPYILSDDFLIQTSLADYNNNDPHIKERDIAFQKLSQNSKVMNRIKNFDNFYHLMLSNWKVYIIDFIPLKNDFTLKKVGYIIQFSESEYFKYFINTYFSTSILILLLSFLIGYFLFKRIQEKVEIESKATEYKRILDMSENIILIVNDCKIINSNNKFLKFLNINNINELGENKKLENIFIRKEGIFCPTKENFVEEINNMKDAFREVKLLDSNGAENAFMIYAYNLNEDNSIIELIDITEHNKEKKELEDKALYDQLTNLYNRHYFEKTVVDKFSVIKEGKSEFSLIMFDIDHFKSINDNYGHNVGDESLKFVSNLCKINLRNEDVIFRFGGEEFVILVENTLENSVHIAENLRVKIDSETHTNRKIPHFTCSFGVVTFNDFTTIEEVLEKVDKLLYKSKKSGRNRVSY